MERMPCADLSIIYQLCLSGYLCCSSHQVRLTTARKLCCASCAEFNNNPSTCAEKFVRLATVCQIDLTMMQVPSNHLGRERRKKEKERGARRRAADLVWWRYRGSGFWDIPYAAKALASCIYFMLVRSRLGFLLAQLFYQPRYQTRSYSVYYVVEREEGIPE